MNARLILAGVAAAALLAALAAWSFRDQSPHEANAVASTATKPATAGAPGALSPASILAIDMRKSSKPAAPAVSTPLTLAREFERASQLKPLYDRVSASPTTPDAKYVLYRILSGCAKKTDPVPSNAPAPQTLDQRRKTLETSLSDDNPQKAVRLKAFDDMRRCDAMEGVTTSKAELDKLLDDAARDGDPRARALQVQREMSGDMPRGGAPITDAQLQTLREVIASRDPAAIVIAGTVLSNTFNDMVIEVGNQHEPLDHTASRQAWRLLACEYGLDCSAGNNELRQACAMSGRCGPASIPDYIYYFETTPNQAQLVDQYQQAFRRAIQSNDWNGLTFARRPNQTGSVFRFTVSGP